MSAAPPGDRGRGQSGQATVELALLLPLVCALLVAALEVGLVLRAQVLLVEVARQAARQASLAPGPGGDDPDELARRVGLDPQRLEVVVERSSSSHTVTVVARYRQPFSVPFLAVGHPVLTLSTHLTVREEAT
jgi:hypothetical protein